MSLTQFTDSAAVDNFFPSWIPPLSAPARGDRSPDDRPNRATPPIAWLNAIFQTPAIAMARPGRFALLSKSEVICTAILDSSRFAGSDRGFSILLVEQPRIKECDINPRLASADGITALDARVLLHDGSTQVQDITPHATRPYPLRYVEQAELKDGTPVLLRPIRPEDEPLMIRFHESLSDESVWRRYFQLLHLRERIDHDRLTRVCLNDFDREVALVAEHRSADGGRNILGVGRLSRANGASTAEFSVLISDAWQGLGVGHLLLEKVIHVGYEQGIHRIVGSIMPDNWAMQVCCRSLGFCLKHSCDGVDARLDLQSGQG